MININYNQYIMVEVLYLHEDLKPNLGYEDKVYHQPKKLSLLKKKLKLYNVMQA